MTLNNLCGSVGLLNTQGLSLTQTHEVHIQYRCENDTVHTVFLFLFFVLFVFFISEFLTETVYCTLMSITVNLLELAIDSLSSVVPGKT